MHNAYLRHKLAPQKTPPKSAQSETEHDDQQQTPATAHPVAHQSVVKSSDTSSFDISTLPRIVQDLKNLKIHQNVEQLKLADPVILCIKKDKRIAVIQGATDFLKPINSIGSALSQTKNAAGIFAEAEAAVYKVDETKLGLSLINIDDTKLMQFAPADIARILVSIVALSENNSFRKTELSAQMHMLIANLDKLKASQGKIELVITLYQGYYPEAKEDYSLLTESCRLLNEISDNTISAEVSLVNKYVLERPLDTQNPKTAEELTAITSAMNRVITYANTLKIEDEALKSKLEGVKL